MTNTELTRTEQLETINRQQLVTATDRLLFSGTPRRFARGSVQAIRMPTRRDETTVMSRRAKAKGRSFAGMTCFISFCLIAASMLAVNAWPM